MCKESCVVFAARGQFLWAYGQGSTFSCIYIYINIYLHFSRRVWSTWTTTTFAMAALGASIVCFVSLPWGLYSGRLHGTGLVYLLQGLVIGAAAASCNILHDTADTEHDHISDVLLLQQEFISANPILFSLFLHKRKESTAYMAKKRNCHIGPKSIPNCYFHNSVFVMVCMYDEHS